MLLYSAGHHCAIPPPGASKGARNGALLSGPANTQELPAPPHSPAKPPAKYPLQGTPGPKDFLTQVSLFQTPKPSLSRASAIQELRSRINGNSEGKLTPSTAASIVPSPSTFPSKRETCSRCHPLPVLMLGEENKAEKFRGCPQGELQSHGPGLSPVPTV